MKGPLVVLCHSHIQFSAKAQSISPTFCHTSCSGQYTSSFIPLLRTCVPANRRPFFPCMAGNLLCILQNSPSVANLPWFCSFPLSSGLSLSWPLQVKLVTLHSVLLHTSLSILLSIRMEGIQRQKFWAGKEPQRLPNFKEWQIILGGKLGLFSCFRVLFYFISPS